MSSSGGGSYPPLAPGTVIQGLTVEAAGVVWWQWLTFFIFGNLFAGYWLVVAILNAHPELRFQIRQLLVRLGLRKPAKQPHSSSRSASTAAQPRSSEHKPVEPSAAQQQEVQQQQQQQQLQQQQQKSPRQADVKADSPKAVASGNLPVTPRLTSLKSVDSVRGDLPGPARSHRFKPPPELCIEQTITPKASLSVSERLATRGSLDAPAAAAAAAAATVAAAAQAPLGSATSAVTPADAHQTPDPTPQMAAADEQGTEGGDSSSYGDEEPPCVVKLEWRNLCYAVKAPTGLRLIVQGVYGCAQPGELQGLMGPSGAGKSTLMDLLSKRTDPTGSAAAEAALNHQSLTQKLRTITSHRSSFEKVHSADGSAATPAAAAGGSAAPAAGAHSVVSVASSHSKIQVGSPLPHLESELLVNGASISRRSFMKLSAYVPQHDNLVPTMTSWEALSFYAGIILPPSTSPDKKRRRIKEVLAMMGITHRRDTLVGGTLSGGMQLRGLSGGERKRLAIGCGLIAGPSLVFLDEPTSGLDSFSALNVVSFLKHMASQNGGTLIASLHQPRSAIWGQLDQVTLLASGRLMYTGPTDGLTRWFTSLGYYYDPTEHGMASDWALDLVSLGFTKPQQQGPHNQDGAQQQDDGSEDGCSVPQFKGLASVASGSLALQGLGSRRHRSADHSQQPAQQDAAAAEVPSRCCMMSGKQELNDAAVAFLQRLRVQHPEWFLTASGAGQQKLGAAAGLAPVVEVGTEPSPGASVAAEGAAAAAANGGGDVDESPFMLQAEMSGVLPSIAVRDAQQQQQQLPLTPPEVLEQGQAEDQGLWNNLYGGWRKFCALLWREALITTRNPTDMGGRMLTFTWVALLSGLVAWSTVGTADSIWQRLGSAYYVLSVYLLMPFVFIALFTSDKRFFAADTTARLYHPFQYYMAKVTVTMPFNILVVATFHLIYYGMVGMRHGVAAMGKSCLISVLMGVTAMQAVYCCSIVASSQDLAFVYAIAWTALNLLVNPYMAVFNTWSLGWGWSWLRFFSPCNFAWQAMAQVELAGRGFDCNRNSGLQVLGLIPDLLPEGGSFETVRNTVNDLGRWSTLPKPGQCVASGDAVLEMYSFGLSFGALVGILVAYLLLFVSVTYLVVWRSSKKRGSTL